MERLFEELDAVGSVIPSGDKKVLSRKAKKIVKAIKVR
jgi:hypothetical protein